MSALSSSDCGSIPGVGRLWGHGLCKRYSQVLALGGVDIEVPAGQLLAIMGPSGSGKSTLLHCLSGIILPDEGSCGVDSEELCSLSDRRRTKLRRTRFGFVFQQGALVPELTARENVALPLLLSKVGRVGAFEAADQWLARFGLSQVGRRRPGEMSGGQMQRLALARALVHSPQVIFADEPTGALDQATGQEVMQLLTATAHMLGATLVVVTHDLQVASWCERLVEIRDGLIHSDRLIGDDQL